MAELLLKERFIFGSLEQWQGVSVADKAEGGKYFNSIVFIQNGGKGVKIFTHGVEFDTELTSAEVQTIVNKYLSGKGKGNIEVTYTEDEGLVIKEKSVDSLTGKSTSTELVQAKAVAGAFSGASSSLIYTPTESGASSYTFQQKFTKLDGTPSVEYPTIKVTEGTNVKLDASADKGLVISATDTTYSAGTGLTLAEGNVFNHTNSVEGVSLTQAEMANQTPTSAAPSFKFKTYAYDDQGHVLGSKDATVELPTTAFKDTTYEVTMTAGNSNEVSLNTKKDGQAESTYTIKGDKGTTVSFANNVMTISSDTASDILGTLNVADTAVANEYVSEVDQTNGKISVTRTKLPVHGVNTTSVDGIKLSLTDGQVGLVDDGLAADLTSKNITLETAETATAGYLKTYILKQGENEIGKIDLPKELVVTGGSVVEKGGEKYLRLTIANQDEPVDIAVKDLVDVYTAGDGIAISGANVVSAKVKTDETYLKVDEDGFYTEGIDTAITNAINALDVTGATVGSVATGTDTVNVIDSLTWSETDGKVSITGTTASAATKTYVDGKFNALDATLTAEGDSNEHNEGYANVITGINQVDGLVSISSTASLPTDVEVARQAAKATTEVVKATGSDSYLTITETVSDEDEHTIYTVGVSGIDNAISTAISTAIDGLDSELTASSEYFTKVVITNGKLDAVASTKANISEAKLNGYSNTVDVGSGISSTDTINSAIAKLETTLDWGTI